MVWENIFPKPRATLTNDFWRMRLNVNDQLNECINQLQFQIPESSQSRDTFWENHFPMTQMGYCFSLANEVSKAKIDMGVYYNALSSQIKFQSIRTIIHRRKLLSQFVHSKRILNWMNATHRSATSSGSQRNWFGKCEMIWSDAVGCVLIRKFLKSQISSNRQTMHLRGPNSTRWVEWTWNFWNPISSSRVVGWNFTFSATALHWMIRIERFHLYKIN